MIFISVGTEKFPFDRLIRIIDYAVRDGLINSKVFAQIGTSTYIPKVIKYRRFLEFPDILNYIYKSEIIVIHAGVGTILNCLYWGKIPIVFPRLSTYKEHVDNHQLEFAEILEKEKVALVAYNDKELLDKISNYYNLANILQKNNEYLSKDNLLDYLDDVVGAHLKR